MRALHWCSLQAALLTITSLARPALAVPRATTIGHTSLSISATRSASSAAIGTITGTASIQPPDWHIWRTTCDDEYVQSQRCTIYCEADDAGCWKTANAIVSTCGPAWSSWQAVASSSIPPPGTEWSTVTSELSYSGQAPETATLSIYTSFSTANVSFVKQGIESWITTMTPVYAMGSPIPSISVDTWPPNVITYMTAPTPDCRFVAVSTWNASYCGNCGITGGTVDLLYWPSATATATSGDRASQVVVDGSTLVSPSVYISLRTLFAKDGCATVGRPHIGSMIAMRSEDISTIVHIGGKVAAYTTGALDYDILTGGLPRASDYQMLPECIMFGCKTMRPMTWSPTLVAPSQVRTLDASWAQCDMALEGLYDPPRALGAVSVAASPTAATAATDTPPAPNQTWRSVPVTTKAPAEATHTAHYSSGPSGSDPADPVEEPHSAAKGTAQPLLETESEASHVQTAVGDHPTVGGSGDGLPERHDPPAITAGPRGQGSTETSRGDLDNTESRARPTAYNGNSHEDEQDPNVGVHSQLTTFPHGLAAPGPEPTPSPLPDGNGVLVAGETLGLGEAIMIGLGRSRTTLSLETQADGETLLAYGTSKTIAVDSNPTSLPDASRHRADDLAFTVALDGNFELHGTPLMPGEPITVGSGSSQTTLAITSLAGGPALVIDGKTTQRLTPPAAKTSSSSVSSSSLIAGSKSALSTQPPPAESAPTTTQPTAGNEACGSSILSEGATSALILWTVWTLLYG